MKSRSLKIIVPLLCLSVVIITVLALGRASGQEIPRPLIAAPGAEIDAEYEFSDDCWFTDVGGEAAIYRLAAGDTAEQLKLISDATGCIVSESDYKSSTGGYSYYYLEDGGTVMLNKAAGYWISLSPEPDEGALMIPESLPGDEEAVEIAIRYIEENNLYDGELGDPALYYSTTGSGITGDEQVIAKRVMFAPEVDGRKVYGVFRITVLIGDNGQILDVYKQVSSLEALAAVQLKTRDEVICEVLDGEGLSSSAEGISKGTILTCELAYYADGESNGGEAYLFPVYVLTGEGEVTSEASPEHKIGEIRQFDIIIDAVKR